MLNETQLWAAHYATQKEAEASLETILVLRRHYPQMNHRCSEDICWELADAALSLMKQRYPRPRAEAPADARGCA